MEPTNTVFVLGSVTREMMEWVSTCAPEAIINITIPEPEVIEVIVGAAPMHFAGRRGLSFITIRGKAALMFRLKFNDDILTTQERPEEKPFE